VLNIQLAGTILQLKPRGKSRGKLQESQGGLSQLSPLRSDGSCDSQAGEAGAHERWPKVSQGGPSDLSPLRSDASRGGQAGRLDHMSSGQKTLKVEINLKWD
jgi:hypothetical protein